MEAAAIIQFMVILLPIAEKAGVDVTQLIQGIKEGKTTDQLIADATTKRNDLPELPFA
jgi:predicted DsbA family dithiol-disulfide isomerase